jgi:predicted Zn finger-like uncharacterized protein
MKIVCDACSAKYSIADDKVKGKVFKIRCKKCSNIIVVRGTAGAGGAEEPAPPQFAQKDTRVYDYGYDEGGAAPPGGETGGDAEAVWHLVIDQEQVGPLTVAEVGQKFAAGQVDAESYVWREGFADWQPLASVDAFAGVISSGGGGAAASGGSSGRDAVASMFGAAAGDEQGTVRSDPGDLFGAAARGGTEDAGGDDAGDLFGARAASSAASASSSSGDEGRSRPARDTGGGKLRGERNENSVLFSLGNLAALASDAPRASASSSSGGLSSSSSSSSAASSGGAQHGGGEGSGLIDIRSMATAYLGPQGAQRKAQSNVGSIDDLPVFSSSSFAEPAVIMPSPQGRQNNKTMVILIAAVGFLAVITLVLVLVVVLGGKGGTPNNNGGSGGSTVASSGGGGGTGDKVPGAGTGTIAGAGSADGSGTGPGTATEGPGPGTAEGTGAEAGTGAEPGSAAGTGTTPGSGSAKKPDKTDKPDKSDHSKPDRDKTDKPDKPDKVEKPPADAGGKCPDEVGCLLAEKPPACCSKYGKGKKKPPGDKSPPDKDDGGGGGDVPESLDSGMIKAGVGKVKSKIFACGDKYPNAKGTLKLSVKVNAAGSVTEASAVSSPDPGLGSCAASAIKGAKFGKTQRGGSFKYPFNF